MPIGYTYELDRLAEEMSERIGQAYKEVTSGLAQLVDGKSAEEAALILNNADVEGLMDQKLTGVYDTYESGITTLLDNTYTNATLSEEILQSILGQSESYLAQSWVNQTSAACRKYITDGIIGGLDIQDIINNLSDPFVSLDSLGLTQQHLETNIVTAYSQYSNAISNMMAAQLPGNTQFVYIGAYDGKTRDNCVKKILDSPATKDQILQKYGNLDNEIWNCRHKWEEITNDTASQGLRTEITPDPGGQ